MQCAVHFLRPAVGYCHVCGSFGCADCLTQHKGVYYCKRDYKPILDEIEREKKHQERLHRPERQRLVVHTRDGQVACGACFAMNLESDGFKLDLCDPKGHPLGKTAAFQFADLKAVFYVKSFDGRIDKNEKQKEWHALGTEMVVEFQDGEIIKGHTQHAYRSDEARFYLIPDDDESNNLSVLVEKSALSGVYTVEQYREKLRNEMSAYMQAHAESGKSQEELAGDFYGERKNWRKALAQYDRVLEQEGESHSLIRKITIAEYNVAMAYIREKHCHRALKHLERGLELDPVNERLQVKATQIRDALKK